MNIKRYIYLASLFIAGTSLTSCEMFNDFLDVVPDNRTELDSEDKILAMLTSAYPDVTYLTACEFSSDNVDKLNVTYPVNERYITELATWNEVTENQNDAPSFVWQGMYGAIASANQILAAIDELDQDNLSDKIKAAKGEALMCRAYAHFVLVNMFCQAYNPDYADTDLGLPYMFKAETTLNPQYERGTLADFYAYLDADVELGLKLISDNIASIPKYHFGIKSANAFAARFYLFYQQWDKAVECANRVLGSNPETELRDLAKNKAFGWDNNGMNLYAALDYIDSGQNCNLLLNTGMSQIGTCFGPFSMYTEYNHGYLLATTETFFAATAPWGETAEGDINQHTISQSGSYDKVFASRVPYLFEYTDEVAQIGYPRVVTVPFTIEETLLVRAEANVMLENYNDAISDLNIWIGNYLVAPYTLTEGKVTLWSNRTDYYTIEKPTIKKEFELPAAPIASGMQENLMHITAFIRRIETLHTGLRFFDVKRYGYTINRRTLGIRDTEKNTQGVEEVTDFLSPRDPRYALQVPNDVISAGFEPNPR